MLYAIGRTTLKYIPKIHSSLLTGRSIQEALLTTVERRQEEEMDLLMGLLEGAKTQHHLVNNARSKEDQVNYHQCHVDIR